jgi:hypothetical protein
MPEVLLSTSCRKRIDPEVEDYVIPNKANASQVDWEYWHLECWEKKS